MPRFRELPKAGESKPVSLDAVRRLLNDVTTPAHFFVNQPLKLEWSRAESETIRWEIFRGRLLDAAQTRIEQTFLAWKIHSIDEFGRSTEPLLSVKLDAEARQVHFVRAIYSYAWEGYHDGNNVYLSRETRKWIRELTGTVHLDSFNDVEEFRDELICRLFHAVVGASRLPLTSVEAPLPGFSLGRLGYFYRPGSTESEPMRSWHELLQHALIPQLAWIEKVKLLEMLLRSVPTQELGESTDAFVARWLGNGQEKQEITSLFRTLFNEVSLTPHTDFVDKTLAFMKLLVDGGHITLEDHVDFLGYLLRQTARHLTAYDLVVFHHRGANYPDALLLDAVMKCYLELIERRPELFVGVEEESGRAQSRKRRRALRQGWLLRRRYEGHLVPDAPTSEGENARILPPPHQRVPEEQILNPHQRTKRLYDGDPLISHLGARAADVLRQSIDDLKHPEELRELGMAIFLDRPLSTGKALGDPDQTPLLSYEAFSRSIAERRLQFLTDHLGLLPNLQECRNLLAELQVTGVAVEELRDLERTGVISLTDAGKVAGDFVILRTTPQTAAEFLDLRGIDCQLARDQLLILRETRPGLLSIRDPCSGSRMQFEFDPTMEFVSRGGVEIPASGVRSF